MRTPIPTADQKTCPETESNRRHEDFQSSALPTELSGQVKARKIPSINLDELKKLNRDKWGYFTQPPNSVQGFFRLCLIQLRDQDKKAVRAEQQIQLLSCPYLEKRYGGINRAKIIFIYNSGADSIVFSGSNSPVSNQ